MGVDIFSQEALSTQMKLHEFQGKELFQRFGIRTPPFAVVTTPDEAVSAADSFGYPVVLKAQVLVGGRGKAGGVKLARSRDDAQTVASSILRLSIKGLPVKKLMVTPAVDIAREHYLGIVLDRERRAFTAMFCDEGGVDIEELAARDPGKIKKIAIDAGIGLQPFQVRCMLFSAGLAGEVIPQTAKMFLQLYRMMRSVDADLVEINPLVVTTAGEVMALDSKVTLDDNSLFRQAELTNWRESEGEDALEREAREQGIAYVKLEGDIGVVGNGAGLVMSTMDAVKNAGGAPACFLDLGGGAGEDATRRALALLLKDQRLKSIFINVFGGITRGDVVARALLSVHEELKPRVPIVIRMTGTRAQEGLALLKGSPLTPAADMSDGARKVVAAAA
jgi:succinyl-CoA synthetase beta subunit